MKKGIPKDLADLAKGAKFLREWARHTVFHPDMDPTTMRILSAKHAFSKASFERRRAYQLEFLNKAERDNQSLNKFFEESGYPPLSKNNSLARLWSRKISRMRELANRKRRKPALPYSRNPRVVKELRSDDNCTD